MLGDRQHFAAIGWRRMLGVLALVAGVELGGLACDLSPRSPEDPGGDTGRLVNLTDPDSTIFQIELGLESGSITSYMNAYADNFAFHPDAADSATLVIEDPGVFDNWTWEVERNTMQGVLAIFTTRSVTFVTRDSLSTGEGTVEIDEDYDLTMNSEIYQGTARLSMFRDAANEWRISQWHDVRRSGSQLPSWSVLRGQNRAAGRPGSGGEGRKPGPPTH